MALIGDFTHYYITTGSSIPNVTQVTYPLDLSELDPNYNKRGTTENITDYNQEESTTFTSSYVSISETGVYTTIDEMGSKSPKMFIQYEVYPSKEHKYASSSLLENKGVLHKGEVYNVDYTYDPLINDFEYAYSYLSTLQGFENLTQD